MPCLPFLCSGEPNDGSPGLGARHESQQQSGICLSPGVGKHEVEIRIESVNKDNSHSTVGIFRGLNKLVTDLIDREYDDDEQETSATKTEVFAFAGRSKAEAKPRRPSTACSSSRNVPILEGIWIDIEPGAQLDQAYPVAKKKDTLLRH